MKQYEFIYDNFEKMKLFTYNKNINKDDNVFIQVFTGITEAKFIEKIIMEILFILPQAEIIGATTGGEILKKRVLDNSTVISFTIFEKTKIKTKLLNNNNNEYELGVNISKKLIEEDTKVIILFSAGLLTNSLEILNGIHSINNNIIVCGGKAGDNGGLKETLVFTKDGISNSGAAAASLTGEQLNITTGYSLGLSTIGRLMTVTKASNNRIYTIDNIKAVDVYKKYLGSEVAASLPMSAYQFPLILIKNGVEVAKVPYSCNSDGSLDFLSNVKTGDKIKFGYENINMLINDSLNIYNELVKSDAKILFVYSCFVRRSFMGEKTNIEINLLNNISPTFGFFTYGEFFTVNNENVSLNVAMTILGISEGEYKPCTSKKLLAKEKIDPKRFFEGKDFNTEKAFINLVNEVTGELHQTNEVLQEQKRKIEQMNSITKYILQMNSEVISSGEFDKFIQVMLDKILSVISKGRMGSILLVEGNKLYYKATKGYIFDKIKNENYDAGEIYNIGKITSEGLFNPMIFKRHVSNVNEYISLKDKPKECLACYIGIDGKAVGLINILNTNNDDDFDEEDKNSLKYICYDIAVALKNFRLLNDMQYMSRHDSLTGIYNRRYFREILCEISNRSKALQTSFIVCWMDLNKFKIINDTYGHDKGDEVLKKFVEIFKMEIGKKDIFARLGGDEFVVIFVNKSENVIEIIDKISTIFRKSDFKLSEDLGDISFAYGLSEFLSDSDDIDELLKMADQRMYEKKKIMKSQK